MPSDILPGGAAPSDMTGWLNGAGVVIAALVAALIYSKRRRSKAGTEA